MSFRLVPKSVTWMTLNGVMAFISLNLENVPIHNRVDLWLNLCTSLLHFALRVRCRCKESSRSLSYLLMSFLLNLYQKCNDKINI